MRISDWSSDVCSSDLAADLSRQGSTAGAGRHHRAGFPVPLEPPRRFPGAPSPIHAEDPFARRGEDGRCAAAHALLLRHHLSPGGGAAPRSEEHTSELQSLMRTSYAAVCLKKKKTN